MPAGRAWQGHSGAPAVPRPSATIAPVAESRRVYKIVFHSQGQVVELYARQVSQGALFGFVEVEELIFGVRSEIVVDPGEESLRREFGEAKRLYLPLHAVLRIEEVEHEGTPRARASREGEALVRPFPVPVARPGTPP